ncbi:MAG: winged helix DNA-binding protein [archaeon]|nr:winged helix DNA-binding protein [archaeon]MCP8305522.1 winged helix DNA-binding protein [archaeon]
MERYEDKSFRVLVTLHNLAAMNEESARTVDDLVKFMNIDESSILEFLKSLTGEGLISEVGGRYYLNYSGTLRILTNYT